MTVGDGGIPEDGDLTRLEVGARALPRTSPDQLSGRTVSHFRIGELLGRGGMGEVYEAEDTRLGRTVALKFLASDLVRDPAAKARFLTEARAASALDHPNLCTILEAGESEDGLLFLAMPRYGGESLQHLIARGPLPVEQALDIIIQAARGLAKAHENGILHRDIKPGNLFLTRDGVVKILDFGIAKLSGEVGTTRAGGVLGTPAYMAPEQSLGEAIDARVDVWSLGVVLYEMLAGRRPFTGSNAVAVVYSAVHETPVPLTRLRPEVPAELDRIVSRMLAKNPEQRHADAAEILGDLRKTLGLPTTGSLGHSPASPSRRRSSHAILAGLFLAILVATAVGFLLWRGSRPEPAPQPGQIDQLTDFQGRETSPSLSPDGTVVVYARSVEGNYDIFYQRVEGGQPINLTAGSPADDIQPAFSPDGQQIAFRSERDGGGIFLMGATGESVRRLTDFGFNPAWSPDGREIAIATEGAFNPKARLSSSQIFRIDVVTGTRRSLAVPDGVQPSWSPHGSRIAFWGVAQPGARRVIWTIPVKGGDPVTVAQDEFYNWNPVWSPDGRFLYFASDRGGSMNIWRVAINEQTGQVLGVPQPVTTSSEWSALPSLSRDGRRLVYATNNSRSFVELVPFDPKTGQTNGSPDLVYEGARSVRSCDVSPDGGWLVLRASSPTDDLLLIRSDGRDLRELTNDPVRERTPQWSPDGRRILFASDRSGKYEAWTIRPDGSELKQVTDFAAQPVLLPFWAPDGRRIGFTYGSQGTALLDLSRPQSRPRLLPRMADGQILASLSWSLDGQLLTGMLLQPEDLSNIPGVVLWSFEDNTLRRLTSHGEDPVFFQSGTRILFLEAGTVQLVEIESKEVREVLSPPSHSLYISARSGPEDRSLCTVRTTNEGDIWSLAQVQPVGPP